MPGADSIASLAVERLSSLTRLRPASLIGLVRTENGWKVTIEMVEKKSIPESMDVLASYEVLLTAEGEIESFERTGLRKRMDTE